MADDATPTKKDWGPGRGNGGSIPPVEHRFKPGQSGNPGGRPKGMSITGALRAALEREHNGRTIAELIAEKLIKEALSGKFPFAKEVLERADGKVTEKAELTVQRMPWREFMANLSEQDVIEMAASIGSLDLLPPALRERAKAMVKDGTIRLGERRG